METKLRILKEAEELFFRYGIKSVTMDDIAKHLGMSKKTIYLYFDDKDSIVHTLMAFKLNEEELVCRKLISDSANIIDEFFSMMSSISSLIGKINPNAFYDLQKYHPKSWDLFKAFKENFIQRMIEDTLAKGIKDGIVRPDISIQILAKLRIEQIEMGFNPYLYPPDKFKILDVQLALIDHFLHGVCTLKGHKLINKHKQLKEEE